MFSVIHYYHLQDTMAKNVQKTGNFEPYTLKVNFTNQEIEHMKFDNYKKSC